jgi:hypothetical protein
MNTVTQSPAITGKPVIDTPKFLDWPTDGELLEPSLSEPTANLLDEFTTILKTHGLDRP